MSDSAPPLRSTIVVRNSSSTRLSNQGTRRIFSHTRPSSDEENQQLHCNIQTSTDMQNISNVVVSTGKNLSLTSTSETSFLHKELNMKAEPERVFKKSMNDALVKLNSPVASSDVGTDISFSSVAARRDWLKNFGKQHESSPFRKPAPSVKASTQCRDDETCKTMSNFCRTSDVIGTGAKPPRTPSKHRAGTIEHRSGGTPPLSPSYHHLECASTFAATTKAAATTLPMPKKQVVQSSSTTSKHREGTTEYRSVDTPLSPSLHRTERASIVAATAKATATTLPMPKKQVVQSINKTPSKLHRNEQVKATDEGYASVAELSKWLASDPTSAKKKKHVRRGRNIVLKSRQFEKDQENVIIVENHISRGAVKDKQMWLQRAFKESEDDASSVVSDVRYAHSEIAVGTNRRPFSGLYPTDRSVPSWSTNEESNCEIITDDAASSLSVADKKDWLKHAFSSGGKPTTAKFRQKKASTEVMHIRSRKNEDAISRAKMRFKERSARKLLEKIHDNPLASTIDSSKNKHATFGDEHQGQQSNDVTVQKDSPKVKSNAVMVDKDSTPVDFRAARDALVQRSKENGHQIQIVNKVYLRKKEYEKIEEENRRKSSVHGLFKPSWDLADSITGRPTNVYEKHYVADIAPKKSFDDLP